MNEDERKQAQRLWGRFTGLPYSHGVVKELVAASLQRRLAADDILLSEAEEDGTVFIVASGSLRTVKYTANGHEVWYADVKPGDLAGDMAALTGGRRTSTIVAKGACTLLAISQESFLGIANRHAEFAMAVARMLAQRLQVTSTRLAELVSLPVSTRLHGELAAMGAPTLQDMESFEIALPPKVQPLSERIHATREATSRGLRDLEERGLLKRHKSKWTVIVPASASETDS